MKATVKNHKIIHWAIRSIACANLLNLVLAFAFSTKWEDLVRWSGLGDVIFTWMMASPVVLILATGLEAWWMRGNKSERRALAIDWLFVIAYISAWLLFLLYAFTHLNLL